MKSPQTYAEWMDCFDRLKEGTQDAEIMNAMKSGSIEWTRGVAERATESLYETVKYRLNQASDAFQKELDNARGSEVLIAKALLSLRKRLTFLYEVVGLEPFPEDVRKAMKDMIEKYAKDTQESLLDSAKSDRTGRLRMLIKNNPLTEFTASEPAERVEEPTFGRARRRVILR